MYKHHVLKHRHSLARQAKRLSFKQESLRRLSFGIIGLVFVCLILISNIFLNTDKAKADSGLTASNLLGQTDSTYTNPDYTTNNTDDATGLPAANNIGQVSDEVIDQADHLLYVADTGNGRVLVYDLNSSNHVISQTATYVLGSPNFVTSNGPGYGCNNPTQSSLCSPSGLAYDPNNKLLFVSDKTNNRIMVYDTSSLAYGMNATDVIGQADFTSGNSGLSATQLDNPTGLYYDSTNNLLYVADSDNNRVLVFNESNLQQFNTAASDVIGQADFTSGNCNYNSTSICSPQYITYDASQPYLFVSTAGQNTVFAYDLSGGLLQFSMPATAILGAADFTSTDYCDQDNTNHVSTYNAQSICYADGITYDAADNYLFVVDASNSRIIGFNIANLASGMSADFVLGQSSLTADNTGACFGTNTYCFDYQGTYTGPNGNNDSFAPGGTDIPENIYFDPTSSQLFVSDYARVAILPLSGGLAGKTNESITAELGQTDPNGNPVFDSNGYNDIFPNQYGLDDPSATAIDSVHHRLFVADQYNNRILVYNLNSADQVVSYAASYELGQSDMYSSTSCQTNTLTSTCFGFSSNGGNQLAYDPTNNYLFVSDSTNNRVLVFDLSSGISNNMPATYVLGEANMTSNTGCNDTEAYTLCNPNGISYDPVNNNLFVADEGNGRIVVYNFADGITSGMSASHELGEPNYTDNSDANVYCYDAEDLYYDAADNYLFDSCFEDIYVYDFSQNGIQNGMSYTYDLNGGYPGINIISGLTYDSTSKRLYFSSSLNENGCGGNNWLYYYDLTSGVANAVNSTPTPALDTTLNSCNPSQGVISDEGSDITYDSLSRNLIISDAGFNRVGFYAEPSIQITTTSLPDGIINQAYSQQIQTADDTPTNFAITQGSLPPGLSINSSTGLISGTPTTLTSSTFTVTVTGTATPPDTASQQYTVNIDKAYLAVNEIGQYNPDNTINWTQNGNDNNSANTTALGLSNPEATALDPINHRLFVADSNNDRILVYQLNNSNQLTDINPIYVFGQSNYTNSDYANCNTQTLLPNEFCYPTGLVYDSNTQRLYVADQYDDRVLVFDASPSTLTANGIDETAEAAIGTSSLTSDDEYSGTNYNGCILSQNEVCGPSSLTLDSSNNLLYVADTYNSRVLAFNVDPTIPTNNLTGENASFVIGEPDYLTNNSNSACATTQNSFCEPQGLAIDSSNNLLYVADSSNNRVLVFNSNPSTMQNGENALYEFGQGNPGTADYTDSNYNTTQNGLDYPQALSYDPNTSQLFIDDEDNNRIESFDVNPSNIVSGENADGLLGQFNYTEDVNAASQYNLNYPSGGNMAYDTTNNQLFIPDLNNFRIMIFDFALLNSTAPGGVVGDNYSFSTPIYYQGTPTFSKTAGSLPPGLTLDSSTGVISGDPTTTGDYTFTENLADNNGSSGTFTDTKQLTIDITGTSNGSGGGGGGGSNNGSGGSGGSSNNGNSNNGGGSSGGTTKTPTKTPTTPPTTTTTPPTTTPTTTPSNLTPIDLDTKPPYVNSIGYVNPSPIGQVYTFTANNNTPHSVTIANVIPPSTAVVSIDGGKNTLTLQVGQKIDESVTPSGKPDISIKLDSIEGDKATFTFARIKLTANNLSTIPTIGSTNSSKNYTLPPTILLGFPWLLFILIALSGANFMYRAYKERRLKKYLDEQLAWAISLAEQKHNLVTLVSHYLRTPLTIVSSGIELALTNNPDINLKTELKDLTNTLKNKVDNLLNAINVTSPTVNPNPYSPAQLSSVGARAVVSDGSTNTVVNPSLDNSTLSGVGSNAVVSGAANFNASSMLSKPNIPKVLLITLGSVLALVGLTDLILRFVDIYNLSLITLLEQIAAMILVTVFIVSTYHSYTNDKKLRDNTQSLLDHQTELDNERNLVITNSLASLAAPLTELKQKLSTLTTNSTDPNTANLTKPSMNGIARFESMLSKFSLITMLKTGSDHALTKDSINLTDLVKELTVKYEATIRAKQLNILTDIKVDYVIQNKALLSVALDSLISNALKYSPEQQTVTISAYSVDNQVHLTVSDHGVGITKDKLQQIMQPFSRIEDTATDFNQEGIGLSLYMDDLIMKYLGGTIDITPTKPGHTGTTTSLLVPSGL